ncbi:PCI domain containing protein [Tritrichomonas foetus]|uniref:PCI domain containing protein n=1 Tax=Tritrichomonas foetus TaxID=1144522 RepID=A0A1J4KHH4_9EUKA|nr:PCI domain containing protein [Tritrichomonas foetus]|eukprot:OHT10863.1 PCI domain containing protein [Tritrichomonas foetus]
MDPIEEILQINPAELQDKLKIISAYLASKRWYELGDALERFLVVPAISGHRRMIFDKLIINYSDLLDSFHFAHHVLLCSDEYPTFDEKIDFLQKIAESKTFEKKPEPKALISLRIVDVLTQKGEFEQALKLLNEIEKSVTEATPLEVRSSFHHSQANLDKARGDFDAFYQHALLYLSTSRIDKDVVLAYDLCMAALFSSRVCSFGELAAHPILDSLSNGEFQWLRDLILLLDRGDPQSITEFNEIFQPKISQSPAFSNFLGTIQTKLALSVFLQVIFSRPFENRTFAFEEVAQACNITIDQVELLVLKALSAEIIKGNIDEVEQKIVVTWCKPKTLGKDRLIHLKTQIDKWIAKVHEQRIALEKKTQDVVG